MRIFIVLSFFILQLFALDITHETAPVYKEIELASNLEDINKAIKSRHKFKKIRHYVRLFQNQAHDKLWLKIPLVNRSDKALKRAFITRWDRVELELYGVEDTKVVFSQKLTLDNYIKQSSSFEIPANSKLDFYIYVKTKRSLDQFYYIYFVEDTKANDFIIRKEKLYHYGLFFGILLTMTMYSFFMYFSIKEKGYLFLGFYQISVLITTSDIRQYLFILFENMPTVTDSLLRGIFEYLIMLLSILFTKEIFNTKKEMPQFNILLNILIIVLLPLNQIYSSINYAYFLYIVYVFVGVFVFIQKRSSLALFYTLAFVGFPLHVVLLNLGILLDWNFYFEVHYAKQVFTCIESFALTMALYLKIHTLVKEKESAKDVAIKSEKAMLEQSRFASMGEMLASIAHQWRQPLNHLDIIMANIQLAFETGKLNKEYLDSKALEADRQLKYMSTTVESFSTFFAAKEVQEEFYLIDVYRYCLALLESRLKKHKIKVLLSCSEEDSHINYKNELTQVLLIVLNNAMDVLIEKSIKEPIIEVIIVGEKIVVKDNAGGIDKEVLPKVFDPFFSTKDKKFGSGLGLYTCKTIMNNLIKGDIKAENKKGKACFTITIP